MTFHRFVTIDGQRHDITGLDITGETSCDRCGRYTVAKTTVQVNTGLLGDVPHDVLVELCAACVGDHFSGLVDVATKVLGRA
jgi:hypothetical protein